MSQATKKTNDSITIESSSFILENDAWHGDLVSKCLKDHFESIQKQGNIKAVVRRVVRKLKTNHPEELLCIKDCLEAEVAEIIKSEAMRKRGKA